MISGTMAAPIPVRSPCVGERTSRENDERQEQIVRRVLNYTSRAGPKPGAPAWVADLVRPATRLANEGGADMSGDGWRWEMIYDLLSGMAREGIEFDVPALVPRDR